MENPEKKEIKEWLANTGNTREWLAAECGVNKGTVNNWLSTRIAIPKRQVARIRKMMEKKPAPANESTIYIKVSAEDLETYSQQALLEGMTVQQWMASVLNRAGSHCRRRRLGGNQWKAAAIRQRQLRANRSAPGFSF